jgi:hypothetical protein
MTCHSGCHPGAAIYQFRRRFSNLSRIFVTNRVFCDLTTLRRLAISSHLDKERFVSARERERERERETERGEEEEGGGRRQEKRQPRDPRTLTRDYLRALADVRHEASAISRRFYRAFIMIPKTPGIALLNRNPSVPVARGRDCSRDRSAKRSPCKRGRKNGTPSNAAAAAIGNRAPDKLLLPDND